MGSGLTVDENDLKEIFALFTSATEYEREQVYDRQDDHFFMNADLSGEYSLTQERREYALDAWRAVCFFLHSKGYSLCKDGREVSLAFSADEFIA
jgi:hypothetical protein